MDPNVVKEARAYLKHPNLLKNVHADCGYSGIVGDGSLVIALYLSGVSRLLDRPMNILVQGPSSSGKSYPISKIANLFPPETVLRATSFSPQSFFYLPVDSLRHKFVIAGERKRVSDDAEQTMRQALRELMSEGHISKYVADGKAKQTMLFEQSGPISYLESSTLAETEIFDEDRTRVMILHPDCSPQQTSKICENLLKEAADPRDSDLVPVVELHHAIHRLLEPREVVFPQAVKLLDGLKTTRIEIRRLLPMILSCVKASTLLHQFQRQSDSRGRLIADSTDYGIAYNVLSAAVSEQLNGDVPKSSAKFLERIRQAFGDASFSTPECVEALDWSYSQVKHHLHMLATKGRLVISQATKGPNPNCYKITSSQSRNGQAGLPSPEELFGERVEFTL